MGNVTLVRVSDGLYRLKGTSTIIADDRTLNRVSNRGLDERWAVRYTDWMSTSHVRRFPTLRTAREWLNSL